MTRAEIARALHAHVEWQALCGADGIPRAPGRQDDRVVSAAAAAEARPASQPFDEAPAANAGAGRHEIMPRGSGGHTGPAPTRRAGTNELGARAASVPPTADSAAAAVAAAGVDTLDALRAVMGDCRRCRLCEARTQIVFGVGNPAARLLFVGEGPGRDEDRRGEPFVGRAGQLLTDIIEKGMKLARSDVYICNVVKCRPPENRNPEPDEIAACRPFLEKQIDLVRPEVIVGLGKFASQTLLASATPISKLRGIWAEYHGIPFMPTLHPAYLLRNPADKRLVWQDVQMVMERLGLPR